MLGPLPVGKDLEARFGELVRQLPAGSQRFMLVAAAESSGDPLIVRKVATEVGIDERGEMLACESGMITINRRVEFRHPLIRSAVYAAAKASERRVVHLAWCATIDGAVDPERRAQHLVAAARGPDDTLADELIGLARRARLKGSRNSEAGLLTQAAQFTVIPGRRSQLLLDAADAALASGAAPRALSLLGRAQDGLEDPAMVAETRRLEGRLQVPLARPGLAAPLLLAAARTFQTIDKQRSRQALLDALDCHQAGRYFTPDEVVRETAELALETPTSNDPPSLGDLILDGASSVMLGDRAGGVAKLELAARDLRQGIASRDDMARLFMFGMNILNELWDDDGYLQWLEHVVAVCRSTGDLMALQFSLCGLAEAKLRSGLFSVAETHFEEMIELTGAMGFGEEVFRPVTAGLPRGAVTSRAHGTPLRL